MPGGVRRGARLEPAALEKILIAGVSPTVSLKVLASATDLPWMEQEAAVFGEGWDASAAQYGQPRPPLLAFCRGGARP